MKSRVSPAKLKEYQELKSFFVLWETRISRSIHSPEHPDHPVNCLNAIEAKYGFSIAFKGLKQAVGDILEMTSHLDVEGVKTIDGALMSGGYLTLSALRMRYRSTYAAVLRRGRIRNTTEFYLLNGIASDQSLDLSSQERSDIDALLVRYEQDVMTSRSTRSRAKTRAAGERRR
jgi:hypothetical protein